MLNHIWLWMIILSIVIAGSIDVYNEITKEPAKEQVQRNLNEDTKLGQVTSAAIKAASTGLPIKSYGMSVKIFKLHKMM